MVNCSTCGYRVSLKSECCWCASKNDALDVLSDEALEQEQERFWKLTRKQRTEFVIAMGLEGFTPSEISTMTKLPTLYVQSTLLKAGVYRDD